MAQVATGRASDDAASSFGNGPAVKR
ncbi:MAG: hypothetical protein QOJ35_2020, partial [Solirubrobacteraceae bacterium]|nr:hypothetical protein [Solirubrobacteraceae bacterium]